MKKLSITLIIGLIIMGYYDGGDITAAFVFAILFAPVIFSKERRVHNED